MEEKIKRVGDALWDDACHNRIANKQDWSKRLYELLDGEFPQEERVGDHVADVEDYLHNKYSFGFCDLCGDFINYDDDQWWDLGLTEGDENEWLEKSLPLWEKQYPDHEETIQDVCPICFHRLTTEEGFRSCPLVESDYIISGGKSHADETLGEFLDETGIEATADAMEISFALLINGLAPLDDKHYPFTKDADKMRDFRKLSKKEFLASYSYLAEIEYDMTKKFEEIYNGKTTIL